MRACLVQLTYFPEAGRVDIYEYSKALAESGVDVDVIVCKNKKNELPDNLTIHQLELSTNAGPINSVRFAQQALREIKRINDSGSIDIIHLFNPAPATFFLGFLLKFWPKRPKVIYDIRTG